MTRAFPWATVGLVLVLVAVHLVSGWTSWQAGYVSDAWGAWVAERPDNALIASGGLFLPFVGEGAWWRLATGPLLHQGLSHLLGNVVVLLAFGFMVEEYAGWGRLLLAVVVSAVGGGVFAVRAGVPLVVGASGAALGLAAAALGLVAWRGVTDRVDRGLILVCATAYLVIETLGGLWLTHVSFPAHLGGAATGLLLALGAAPRRFPTWLGGGLAAVFLLVACGGWLLG
ncbi:MAG: rhomboid family intramembrane serine protease [Alphaproteobacteria bacterium]|nr:rhomboid family intramembrane serine protease [Alphaproteobacteria bacterium]